MDSRLVASARHHSRVELSLGRNAAFYVALLFSVQLDDGAVGRDLVMTVKVVVLFLAVSHVEVGRSSEHGVCGQWFSLTIVAPHRLWIYY